MIAETVLAGLRHKRSLASRNRSGGQGGGSGLSAFAFGDTKAAIGRATRADASLRAETAITVKRHHAEIALGAAPKVKADIVGLMKIGLHRSKDWQMFNVGP